MIARKTSEASFHIDIEKNYLALLLLNQSIKGKLKKSTEIKKTANNNF